MREWEHNTRESGMKKGGMGRDRNTKRAVNQQSPSRRGRNRRRTTRESSHPSTQRTAHYTPSSGPPNHHLDQNVTESESHQPSPKDRLIRVIRSWLLIFASLILVISLFRFVEGFQDWREARHVKQQYLHELKQLELRRNHLKDRIEKLQTNELIQERLARGIGLVKPGETVIRIIR